MADPNFDQEMAKLFATGAIKHSIYCIPSLDYEADHYTVEGDPLDALKLVTWPFEEIQDIKRQFNALQRSKRSASVLISISHRTPYAWPPDVQILPHGLLYTISLRFDAICGFAIAIPSAAKFTLQKGDYNEELGTFPAGDSVIYLPRHVNLLTDHGRPAATLYCEVVGAHVSVDLTDFCQRAFIRARGVYLEYDERLLLTYLKEPTYAAHFIAGAQL